MKLPGDFHVHTCMRPVDDGAEEMTPAAVAAAMRSRSFGAFGLSPHFHFDSDFGAVCAFLDAAREETRGILPMFRGVETECIDAVGSLPLSPEQARRLDYVIAAPDHYNCTGVVRPPKDRRGCLLFHQKLLIALAENMPIDILRVRDDDIPGLVMDGVVDLGIIGENVLEEELLSRRAQGEDPRYFTLRRLDFGGCRLSLATPVDEAWNGPAALDGKRIATSYPHLLKRYLDQKGISFKSCLLNGSVEVAPRAGLADAICDLVSTGATLEANGLREVEVIYRSKACLIQRDGEMADAKQQLIDRLLTRIQGVIQARESKYIMMHAPTERLEEVVALLPGAERPTILPLAGDKQRVAMHMVSSETLFWETMEKLKALGASSILVLPIEKMME